MSCKDAKPGLSQNVGRMGWIFHLKYFPFPKFAWLVWNDGTKSRLQIWNCHSNQNSGSNSREN